MRRTHIPPRLVGKSPIDHSGRAESGLSVRSLLALFEEEFEVGGADLLVGVDPEIGEDVVRPPPGRFDLGLLGFGVDLDELAQFLDHIEGDRELADAIPLPSLLDRGDGVESERVEDRSHRIRVVDDGFELASGLRGLLDERPLVSEGDSGGLVCIDTVGRVLVGFGPGPFCHGHVFGRFSDPERLVGLGEVPMGRIVIGIDLLDATDFGGPDFGKPVSDPLVLGSDLHLDLVHARAKERLWLNLRDSTVIGARRGNVILKGRTGLPWGMSDEPTADEADESGESEETPEEETGLQDGDFVELEYTARTVDTEQLVDTTDRDVAEEADVETEGREFTPRTLVLGEGHLFPSVEEDIIGREVGESGSVVVPAQEAFGEYQEDQVRTVSAEKIPEDDRYPGAHVDIDGQHGHVETIIGGRARVDFNHPLAGEDVEYEYEIVGTVEDRVEKAQGLIQTMFDVELDMHIQTDEVEEEVVVEPEEEEAEDEDEEADEEDAEGEEPEESEPETEIQTVEKETLYIESSPQLQFNQQWMMSKQQILGDVMSKVDVDRVIVQEIIEGPPQMPGMGAMGGMGGGDLGDVEASLEDADIDADEIIEELGGEEDLEE